MAYETELKEMLERYMAELQKASARIASLESELAKERGFSRPVRKSGAGNAWDETSQGLFTESSSRRIGPPRMGTETGERTEIGDGLHKHASKPGPGITSYDGTPVSKEQIRAIDKREAAERARVQKGTKVVPGIGEGLAQGRRMRGR